jgi:hypothetical protein
MLQSVLQHAEQGQQAEQLVPAAHCKPIHEGICAATPLLRVDGCLHLFVELFPCNSQQAVTKTAA